MKNKPNSPGEKSPAVKNLQIATVFGVLILALVVLIFTSMNVGTLKVTPLQLYQGLFVAYDDTVATIYDLRFPRMVIAILAGAAIAVSGTLFQAVLRNPLADPGIIGIASGASLAAIAITAFVPTLFYLAPMGAFVGGLVAFALVYGLSWRGGLSPLRIILVGVAVNAVFTGIMSVIDTLSGGNATGVAAIVNGNITMKTWADVHTLVGYVILGLVLALAVVKRCNLLALEDKTIRNLGINVDGSRMFISVVAVLLASISTAVAGVVAFIGLLVPHIGRILVGSDHRVLVPFSILFGAFTFLLADTIGRTVAAPYELSAAVIMAIVGGPFFILLLRGSQRYGN